MNRIDEQIEGCILCGSIGDACGSSYENEVLKEDNKCSNELDNHG